jgi:predicted transglutaminase-like cysteine proteinase
MSVFYWPRNGTLVLALAFAVATTSSALAWQAKRVPPPAPGVMLPAPAPARYFTINEVLAKRDGQRVPSPGRQLASATMTLTDEPPGRHVLPAGEPFGLTTFRAPEGLLWVKWRAVERQSQAESAQVELCRADRASCLPHASHFLRLVEFAAARTGRARIELVNRAVNSAIRYTSDYSQHGVADLWTAPLATLATGRGDCEDYAIAKYVILRAAGVPAHDLRLVLVRDRAARQDHAVLAVRDNGQWLVLDNRHATLAETGILPHFAPLFALDHNGVSLFASPYAARPEPDDG